MPFESWRCDDCKHTFPSGTNGYAEWGDEGQMAAWSIPCFETRSGKPAPRWKGSRKGKKHGASRHKKGSRHR